MINAHILRNAHVGEKQPGKQFWMQTVNGLFESAESEGACEAGAAAQDFSPKRHKTNDLKVGRLSGRSAHYLGKLKGQRSNCKLSMFYCAVGTPAYKAKTSYFCKQCGDWLHFECFEEYHSKTQPVSQYEK
jgi:hypothetical protein